MKTKKISLFIIFIIFVMILGFLSAVNLIKFYVADEIGYNEWTPDLGNKFETDIASTFFEKFEFVNFNGAIRKILNQHEMNGVVKLNNDYLVTTFGKVPNDTFIECIKNILSFKRELDNRGIKLIFTICPYTSSKYDSQLPIGVEDFGNENLDIFAKLLSENGINVIDIREELHNDSIDQYEMMYKTDHHWNTECGFYAFTKVADEIERLTGTSLPPQLTDYNSYSKTIYSNWHLGSRGQRTGAYYAGIDDFELILPNFETSINNGTYESEIINYSALKVFDEKSRYTYDFVLGSLGSFKNNLSSNDLKIFLYTDSFGKALSPFLIISYKELRTQNYYTNFSIEDIDKYNPDVFIYCLYGANAWNPENYCFTQN